jgi:hypothetical protein
MRCIGARERCACATSCTICDSTVCRPHLSATHDSAAAAVERGADHLVAGPFFDRHRLAGEHRFVDARAFALEHHAIDRHLFARTNAQAVATWTWVSGMSSSLPSSRMRGRGLGRQAEQRLDRGAGLERALELQQLAEQGQRDDDRRRLEIHADAPVRNEAGNRPGATVATTL